MWSSTVGLVNGKHRYLTAETFGFKINSNGQQLKRRQQWTIEPFPENLGPDGSISSAASVSSQCQPNRMPDLNPTQQLPSDPNDPCILTFSSAPIGSSLTSVKSSSNGSNASDQDTCGEEHENVAIKSHLNKYLAVDSFGNVTCDSEEKTETARFTITICSMSQGKSKDEHIFWAFKNVERGYYLGTTDDGMICCNAKMPKSRAELWHLHLIPARGASFFSIKSLGRKRFARVVNEESGAFKQNDDCAQVQLDSTISWGQETLFQFNYYEGGRYSLLTSDNKHLTNEGKCISWKGEDESSLPPAECLFTLEYHSGFLAFRDAFGHYLAAAGRSSVFRSRSIGVSRDELFVFEVAPIQVSLKATFNNRWVSCKQGVDLSANQTDITSNFETFQLTYHKQTQNWSIMTKDCNFWTISANTNTVSVCRPGDYEGLTRGQFKLVWSDSDATFSIKYVDPNRQERWIAARKSGQLFLGGPSQDPVKFIMRFQNRRLLNLRPVEGSGFVGLKGGNSKHIEANKTAPDSIAIEYSDIPTSITLVNGLAVLGDNTNDTSNHTVVSGVRPNVNHNDDMDDNKRTINLFNVKLNSTKMGQSVLDRFNNRPTSPTAAKQITSNQDNVITNSGQASQKEMDCGIDDNNNNNFDDCGEEKMENGSVESAAAPSVASIINSFSSAKISSNGNNNNNHQIVANVFTSQARQQAQQPVRGLAVSKLASSFECPSSPSNQQQQQNDDTASVVTSYSSASAASSVISNGSGGGAIAANAATAGDCQKGLQLADQVAQSECCYMKVLSNDRYLVVGDTNDSSILSDATNKACAQSWILELRSHNSIAIRTSDNHAYLQLGTNGTIYLSRCEPKEASLWEF